eukprot:gene41657-56386_t
MNHSCAVAYMLSLGICATFFTIIAAMAEKLFSPKLFGPVIAFTIPVSVGMFCLLVSCAPEILHFLHEAFSNRFIRWEFVAYVLVVALVFADFVILAECNVFVTMSKFFTNV